MPLAIEGRVVVETEGSLFGSGYIEGQAVDAVAKLGWNGGDWLARECSGGGQPPKRADEGTRAC
jgi:hypothetical protein